MTGTSDGPGHGAEFTVSLPRSFRRRDTDTRRQMAPRTEEPTLRSTSQRRPRTSTSRTSLMGRSKPTRGDVRWRGVLRIDRQTFCNLTTAGGKERSTRKSRRCAVLAMIFARTLQAYGVRPEMPGTAGRIAAIQTGSYQRWRQTRDGHHPALALVAKATGCARDL